MKSIIRVPAEERVMMKVVKTSGMRRALRPEQKCVVCMKSVIITCTTIGLIVVDPRAGTSYTGKACMLLQRC